VRLLCPLTDAVSSSSSALLARNLFFGYMFGRVVENTGGSGALWLTYVLSAVGEVGPMGEGGELAGRGRPFTLGWWRKQRAVGRCG
jgi:hypothetical protein